jgi:RNA polymerase sigma factor (sigma-70 family)
MTDQELAEGCRKELRQFQEALYRRFSGKMMAVCLRYCQNREDAEDAMMETFMKVFDHIGSFSNQGSLEGWVRRIAVNTSINKIRSRRNMATLDESLHEQEVPDSVLDSLETEALFSLMGKLPDGYRVVFNLHIIEEMSHKEIAELLRIEEASSRSQLSKARKYLQRLIQQQQEVRK